MKALFFIEIPEHSHTENLYYQWYKIEPANESGGFNLLTEIKTLSLNCEVVLIFPGFNITLKKITSKLKNRKKLQKAIAYELEEQLSDDIEELFFAYHYSKNKNSLDVAIINKIWFEQWLDVFSLHEISLSAAISDLMLLETMSQDYLLIEKNTYFLLKTPSLNYVIDRENIGYFLGKLKETLADGLFVYGNTSLLQEISATVPLKQLSLQNSLKLMTENYDLNNSFNLLQGDYKPKQKQDWQQIKWTAIGLFGLLFIASTFQAYQHWQLTQKEAKLDQQRLKIFQHSFPEVKRVVNPLVQMKNELEKLKNTQQQQGLFFSLLAKVAIALTEMLSHNSIELTGMNFSDNSLTIKMNANSIALINQVNRNLTAQQLKVEIESSNKEENQVNAIFKIAENKE